MHAYIQSSILYSMHTSAHVNTSQRPSDARIRNSKFFSTRKYLKSGLEMTCSGIVALIVPFE